MKKDIKELFCHIDDFCKDADAFQKSGKIGKKCDPTRVPSLTISEIMTIMLLYHTSPCKNFKFFYKSYLQIYKDEFPNLLSYQRFVALIPRTLPYFLCLLKCLLVNNDHTHFVDATSLPVCHNKRIKRHKVFKDFAKRGKTSMGWFYGLKLHLIINRRGELVNFKLTSGNCDDRKPVPEMAEGITGLMAGDKGYISSDLFKYLFEKGLKLITGIKNNMKNKLLEVHEKIILRKRSIIETVFDYLKNKMEISHTRHRSPINSFVHLFSTLVSYSLNPKKPKISMSNLIQN
jgi:hypothetical protein